MARGINKAIIIGNLGHDPEIRQLTSGDPVVTINIATTESWKDKKTGELQVRTEWHRVVFFKRLAEIVGEYLKKGSKIYVEGSIRTRKWQEQSGQDRYTTEIVASNMQMLDSLNAKPTQTNHSMVQQPSSPPTTQPPKIDNPTVTVPEVSLDDNEIPF